jgi:PKD repeat protein
MLLNLLKHKLMSKFFTKSLFLCLIITAISFCRAAAQTITIGNIDPGPYSVGSTMAVPVNINYTDCIPQTNEFQLYLSNAAGVFSGAPVATVAGFYISFMNFTIPAGTPAGTGYRVKITSSANPGATIVRSAAFSIAAGTGVTAGITGAYLNNKTGVFGTCNSTPNFEFDFQDNSSPKKSSVTFFNESTQTASAPTPVAAGGSFTADQTNYTVIVKATSGGIVGTFAYPLINNQVTNQFGATGSGSVCLVGGIAHEVFTVPTGKLATNFPGDTYMVNWDDGTPNSIYTLCDILAAGGQVSHDYTKSSCGLPNNSFKVTMQPSNTYCGGLIGQPVSSSALVATIPENKFSAPLTGCTNTPVVFTNNSNPGSDPNSNNCINNNARYSWYINGTLIKANLTLAQAFNYTFTTPGTYQVMMELQSSSALCTAPPAVNTICIQNKPQPAFHLTSSTICIADGPVVPVNTSIIPAATCVADQYTWSVNPTANVTITGANTAAPSFAFAAAGNYNISLNITDGCGNIVPAVTHTVSVNTPPAVSLSADYGVCGANDQTLIFDPNATATKTTIDGTANKSAVYKWTVTPQGGIAPATFAGGTSAASQYPHITFPAYGTYAVSVSVTNNCGTAAKTQNITFNSAPVVNAGKAQSVCAGTAVNLKGTVTGTYNSVAWASNGTGTFTTSPNALSTTYMPSTADINAGTVSLTLTAATSSAICSTVASSVVITVLPGDNITSSATAAICSGKPLGYQVTDQANSPTYTWTVDAANTTAIGAKAGTGSTINDVLINTSANDEKATYLISVGGGVKCSATNFVLTVTVSTGTLIPKFTFNAGPYCGPNSVVFTNTSVPVNGQFSWDFGDGTTYTGATPPAHSFPVPTNGMDAVYTVKLTMTGACTAPVTYSKTITISPAAPDAEIYPLPTSACGTTTFTIENKSPGTNATYVFYLKDEQGNDVLPPITKTNNDKSDAVFANLISNIETVYTVYMIATDHCGNSTKTVEVPLPISPGNVTASINTGDNLNDCYPFTATLTNASVGTSFYYNITNPDGTVTKLPAVKGTQTYTFPGPGIYMIQLFSKNDCSPEIPSNIYTYTIYALPQPAFTYSVDCNNVATFTNTTPDQDNALGYTWDFGDGSPTSSNPTHQYTYNAATPQYKVTLTAINTATNCSATATQELTILPGLAANFNVEPSNTINIPDYHFDFVDVSTGSPTSWLWDFGDGQTSTLQNPGHTYAYGNVGQHTVTLTVSKETCTSQPATQIVNITGVPGQLYLPNAFMPGSTNTAVNRFLAKGGGIKVWHLQIFNNYGQLVWETTKLDSNGSPVEGWDGTFKGAAAPQGTYTWQASATFINGSQWKGMSYNINSLPKTTGTVNLIR